MQRSQLSHVVFFHGMFWAVGRRYLEYVVWLFFFAKAHNQGNRAGILYRHPRPHNVLLLSFMADKDALGQVRPPEPSYCTNNVTIDGRPVFTYPLVWATDMPVCECDPVDCEICVQQP